VFCRAKTRDFSGATHHWRRRLRRPAASRAHEIGLEITVRYLGIEVDDALEMAEQTEG
jgi:hypothetical protein